VDDVGGVGDRTKQPVQFRYYYDGFALLRGGKQFAPRRTAGERLPGADSRILELLGKVQPFHGAVRSDALALRFESQATVGLFFTRNTDVADGVFHGVAPGRATPR